MKVRNSLISLLLILGSVYARATSVAATITDTDTTVWGNCKWAVRLNNPRPDIVPSVGGTPLTAGQLNQSGVCNSSGVMSLTLVDNTTINIFGTTWQFTITPNASSNSGVASTAVSGASQSLSTFLSGIVPVVRFLPGPGAYGYADAEVIGSLLPGAVYFNTTPTAIQRIWSGTAWANNGGGSGGSPAFSAITSGTNTGQGLVVGAGSVFTTASNGVINANEIGGVLLSGLGTGLYKFTAGVPTLAVAGDFPTLNQSTTGNAATATALAANPTDCGGGQFANAIDAQGNLTCATPSGGGTPAFPVTVTGGVSGGIPYFNSTTQESASAAGTVNTLIKWGGAGNPPIASSVIDNGTTVSTAEALSVLSLTTTVSGGAGGFYSQPEGTTATAASGSDICYADSTVHSQKCSYNNGLFFNTPQTIASGAQALGTGAISSATCATVVTTTATGAAATDAIEWNPNGSIKAVTGYVPATTGGLTIAAYPTANAVNFDVCNWTSGSITPGAVTLNWRVVR